jgi:hypothetical protein
MPSLPFVTGAFVQLNDRLAFKDATWWQTELASMKSLGMDTLIVQRVAIGKKYYYPTKIAGCHDPFNSDSLAMILDAADQLMMKVYLGVHFDPFQPPATFDLPANTWQAMATLNELHTIYGRHASLAGWYMPQEFSDDIAFKQVALCEQLTTYTRELTRCAHASTGLPVLIAPYFGQRPNGPLYAEWWGTTGLPSTGVDIFALQDGVGTHRTSIEQSLEVFLAMMPILAAHGVVFWANNESFNQIHGSPVDCKPFEAIPTDIKTFTHQIQAMAPTVKKSVTFEFTTYMSTQFTAATNALYEDYYNYFHNVLRTSE